MIGVTGATGNVGSIAAKALREAGVDIRLLVRDPDRVKGWGLRLDLLDRSTFEPALSGCRPLFLHPPAVHRRYAGRGPLEVCSAGDGLGMRLGLPRAHRIGR